MVGWFVRWFVGFLGWLAGSAWLASLLWLAWLSSLAWLAYLLGMLVVWLVGWLRICFLASFLALNTRNSTKRRLRSLFVWVSDVQLTLPWLDQLSLSLVCLFCFCLLAYIAWFALLCLLSFAMRSLTFLVLLVLAKIELAWLVLTWETSTLTCTRFWEIVKNFIAKT